MIKVRAYSILCIKVYDKPGGDLTEYYRDCGAAIEKQVAICMR